MLQGKPIEGANTCAPLASASKEELAGVEDAIRINIWRDMVFRIEDKVYTEEKLLLADSNFFSFFSPLSYLKETRIISLISQTR